MSARAYRLGPRSKAGGPSSSRVDWDRAGRIALVLVLFVILALYINPAVNFLDAWRDRGAESAQLEDLKAEHAKLTERAATLSEPDAAERGARRQGMVAPGERSIVICEPAADCDTSG